MVNLTKIFMDKNSLFYKIGFNTIIQFSGKGISVILGFLTVALLTRYLGAGRYGNFTLIFAYMSFFSVFADFGLQITMVKELSKKNTYSNNIYGTYLWLKIILVLLSTILALIALLFFPYSIALKIGILIGALAVGVGGLSSYGTTIFQSNIRLDLVIYIDVVVKVITVSLIVFFVFLMLNFYALVSTVLIGNLFGLLISIIVIKNFISFDFKYNKNLAKKMVRLSIPIGFTSFFSLFYFKMDTVMLSFIKNSYEVGIYSLAYKILENILVLWAMYMASVYPILSIIKGTNDNQRLIKILKNCSFIAFCFSFMIVTIGYIFAPLIINIFGGNKFIDSISSLRILLFAVPLLFINNIFYYYFIINEKIWNMVFIISCSLIFNFIVNLMFIPKNGYIAASWGTVATELVLTFCYIFVLFRKKFYYYEQQTG